MLLGKTTEGSVVQLVRMPPCHGGGRGFESRPVRRKRVETKEKSFDFFILPPSKELPPCHVSSETRGFEKRPYRKIKCETNEKGFGVQFYPHQKDCRPVTSRLRREGSRNVRTAKSNAKPMKKVSVFNFTPIKRIAALSRLV